MAKYLKTEQGYIDASIFAPASFKPAGKSYLTFSSPKSFTLKVNDSTKHWDGTLEYFSADKVWAVWDGTTILSAYNNDGEYVLYLRGTGNTKITGRTANGASNTYRWVLTGSDIACVGNIENLLDYATVESGQHPTMAEACYVYMFYDCTSLTQAPTLTATTLADYCYCGMFVRCTSLTQTPVLPAITLSYGCYQDMFYGCTGLTQAPALPATMLASYCYSDMFYGCTGLTQAPALPATTLASYCYYQMFWNCTNLTQAPALPATTLAEYCYRSMFSGCTSLTKAPALPATTLANNCYERMFKGCTSLTQAPALPATTLASGCYGYMFERCTALKLSSTKTGEYTQEYRIPTTGTGTTATNAFTNMLVSTGGTFTGIPAINTTYYLSTDNMIVRDTEVATLNGYVGSMIDVASIQSDWNQNDDTQPDYVKNRPFYTGDPVETVLVEESSVSFAPSGGFYNANFPTSFNAEFGQTYKISWDGTVYECTCKNFRNLPIIGNQSIMSIGPDTGEPFIILNESGPNETEWDSLTTDTSASHTISISGIGVPVIKIDEKYLPELSYMNKANPTGTGSFSLNRKPGTTVGECSFAEGTNTTASGTDSHAEGLNTIASGEYSHTEGTSTTASGTDSHAEGTRTTASALGSHAEGWQTTASGTYSHAEGFNTIASGDYSHTEGHCTKASSFEQHVQGKFNIEDTANTYAHIVGNGTSTTARSNAHTLDWSGNAWYAGTVEGKALILPSSTANSTKKFKITVDDSGAITATEVT